MRESEAIPRKRVLLLLRYVLILSTGAVGMLVGHDIPRVVVGLAVILALVSNLYLTAVSPIAFFHEYTQSVLLLVDTALVSGILLLASAQASSFLLFFLVMILSAYVENLVALALVTALVGFVAVSFFGVENGLIQVAFMVIAAVYYGYLILPERAGEWVDSSVWFGAGRREEYALTLFTTGKGPDSIKAFNSVREFCEEHLAGEYRLSVVDVLEEPERARSAKVYATPTLVKERPGQVRSIFGEFSSPERIRAGLGLRAKS